MRTILSLKQVLVLLEIAQKIDRESFDNLSKEGLIRYLEGFESWAAAKLVSL